MDIERLKKHLYVAADMEQGIYIQEQVLEELKAKANRLGVPNRIIVPVEPIAEPTALGFPSVFFLFGLVIEIFAVSLISEGSFGSIFGGIFLFMCGLTPVVGGWAGISHELKKSESYQKSMALFDAQCVEYRKKVFADKQRIEKELQQKKVYLADIEQIEKSLSESRQRLQTWYAQGIVFPKYQNLPMICSLYEYLCAGRCSTLEGFDGGYNILETEIRLNKIVTHLDSVVKNLELIRQNQYLLHVAIQESIHQTKLLANSTSQIAQKMEYISGSLENQQIQLKRLRESSELTAYQTERVRRELSYMNQMDYLSGRNDDVFSNTPPTF